MKYTAIIFDENGTPMVQIGVTNLSTNRIGFTPLRLPSKWTESPRLGEDGEMEELSITGPIIKRLEGNWSVPEQPVERLITVPD